MEDLNAVLIFIKVAECAGFIAAARSLNLPKSTISLKISELEQRLGVRLFHRTTRRVSLTEEGKLYYEYCLPIMNALQEANSAIASLQGKPQGTLRLTAPVLFVQQFLAPILPEFLVAYPDIKVVLDTANQRKDLVKEGYDLAIRVGQLEDSTFIMRHIGMVRLRLIASVAYIQSYGEPMNITELKTHSLLEMSSSQNKNEVSWTLENEQQETETIHFRSRLVTNDTTPIYQAVSKAIGIGLLPEFLCRSELECGNLVRILPKWSSPPTVINAIYPSRKYLPKKVRVFLQFLAQKLEL